MSEEVLICQRCGKARELGERCGCEVNEATKIDYPENGLDVFTYFRGYKYPFPAAIDQHLVELDAASKRALISFVRYYWFILFLPFRFIKWWSELQTVIWKPIGHPESKYPPRGRFCKSGREILRAGECIIKKHFPHKETEYKNFLWGLVMIWEFDNAYRFRGQDILGEFNSALFRENPRKEILRLLRLGMNRERLYSAKGVENHFMPDRKWRLIYGLAWVMLFIPKVKRIAIDFFQELNISEVRFTPADWYYVSERWDYEFGGVPYKERLHAKLKEDEEWLKTMTGKKLAIQNAAHKGLPMPQLKNRPISKFLAILPSVDFFEMPCEQGRELINNTFTNFKAEYERIKAEK